MVMIAGVSDSQLLHGGKGFYLHVLNKAVMIEVSIIHKDS